MNYKSTIKIKHKTYVNQLLVKKKYIYICKVLYLIQMISFTFFLAMGVTVDRCQGEQGENDKSQ